MATASPSPSRDSADLDGTALYRPRRPQWKVPFSEPTPARGPPQVEFEWEVDAGDVDDIDQTCWP